MQIKPLICRSNAAGSLTGTVSPAAKAYAAWLLGKCGTPGDLSLIREAFLTEKADKSVDLSSEDPMKYRNYVDAAEQLMSCEK
jgi:hypothetical protein